MKLLHLGLLLFTLVLFLSGCSKNTSEDNSSNNDFIELQEQAIQLSLKLNDNIVKVYSSDINSSEALLKSAYSMMKNFEDITQQVELSLVKFQEFTNEISQEFTLSENYTDQFTINSNFSANTPVIDLISSPSSKYYFMVSSASPFLKGSHTIKTLFNDSDSLIIAWQRAIEFSEDENMFIRIYEVSNDGNYSEVSGEMMIPKNEVQDLNMDLNI